MVRLPVSLLLIVGFFTARAYGACEWFPGQEVRSCNEGRDGRLEFQSDGNLVAYNGQNTPIWASDTRPCGRRAVFQDDGNLVVYNRGGKPVFASGTDAWLGKRLTFSQGVLSIYDSAYETAWKSSDFWRRKGCCDSPEECRGGGPVGKK